MAPNALTLTQERKATTMSGGFMLLALLALVAVMILSLIGVVQDQAAMGVIFAVSTIAFILVAAGFFTLQPNEAAALTLFDNYKGTERAAGLRWVWPWYRRRKISLRVRNVTGQTLKVNDKR